MFEYSILTKIHVILTYDAQRKIKDELKANATSVPCDLGSGNHGHLGLLLTSIKYPIPYIRPLHLGILNIELLNQIKIATNNPYTVVHLVNIRIKLITNFNDFGERSHILIRKTCSLT